MDLLTELESLIPELEKGLDQASSLQEMEALRVEFLGRKGRIARIMSRLPELEPAQRPLLGQTANRVKESLTAQFEAKKTALDNAEEAAALARFDAGLPGRLPWRGSLHPVTMVMEEICTIFMQWERFPFSEKAECFLESLSAYAELPPIADGYWKMRS